MKRLEVVFGGPVHRTAKDRNRTATATAKDRTIGCGCLNSPAERLRFPQIEKNMATEERPVATGLSQNSYTGAEVDGAYVFHDAKYKLGIAADLRSSAEPLL